MRIWGKVCVHLWGQKMNVKRFLSVSVLAATCALTFGALDAQTLRRDNGPAELSPSSFTANQYVDSKGCVYIRAGVDGNTNWVPRVTRARKVVCGLSPSIRSGTATASAPVRQIQPPVQIGAATPAPKSPAPSTVRAAGTTIASVLAPKPVRTVASQPVVKQRVAPTIQNVRTAQPSTLQPAQPQTRSANVQTITPNPQPRIRRVAPTAQVAQKPRRIATTTQRNVSNTQTCQGASAISQRYIGGRDITIRCGPQTGPIVTRAGDVKGGTFRSANGQVLDSASVNPNAIVVPRHVYEQQQAARVTQAAPKGYRNAWSDDRLNSRRAHQTLAGKAQSDLIWTQTVPRRLIVRDTGRDVTRSFPGLKYPYTSVAQQNAGLGQGTRQVVSSKGTTQRVVKQQAVRQKAVVSTRSTTPRKPAQVAGKRYVQVGTFGVASNAQQTAHGPSSSYWKIFARRKANAYRACGSFRIVRAGWRCFASGA